MTVEEKLARLQGWVETYSKDVSAVQAALFSGDMPDESRRLLVGALNYVIDALDLFPDHYKGLGVADDALILRIAAQQAVAAGADHVGLKKLADEGAEVGEVVGELAVGLAALVAKLPDRIVRGRDANIILNDKDARSVFAADLGRELRRHESSPIELGPLGADGALKELERMVRHGLGRVGIK